jgi:phenylalanyl-tRNA synthetase beta chain
LAYNQNRKNFDLKFYEFGNVYRFENRQYADADILAPYTEEKHLDLFLMGNKDQEIWNKPGTSVDFYDLKFAIEAVLKKLGVSVDELSNDQTNQDPFEYGLSYSLDGKVIGSAGKLRREILQHFDLKKDVFYGHLNWNQLLALADGQAILFKPVPKFPAVRRDLALVLDKHITFGELRKAAFKAEPELLSSVMIFDVYEGDKIPADKKSYAISFTLLDKEKTLTDKIIDQAMTKILQQIQKQFGATLR